MKAETMTTDNFASDSFFDTYSSTGGGGAVAFAFEKKGDTVKGTIVSLREMDQTYYSGPQAGQPIPDPKRPGKNKKQIMAVLDTDLRNWDGCKRPGKDMDGNELPPSEDTGARAIYIKGWMIGAISDAVSAATKGERRAPHVGDKIAVQLIEEHDTRRQNPKKFKANVQPKAPGADLFDEAEQEKTDNAVDDVEVPF